MIGLETRHRRDPDPKALQVRYLMARLGVEEAHARLIADLRYGEAR